MLDFPPTRAAALARLNDFLPYAGIDYAKRRNFDLEGHAAVSRLSPYLRHRLISEEEVLAAVLRHHSAQDASKFIAEVCWRTYWKGVLERRPALWTRYQSDLTAAWNNVQTNSGLRQNWEAACKGETGIDGFDHWAKELAQTGYLHNHARMWFASIWIFTLRLPWTLGADFFMRHLLDGDPASNTLSWRWVAGLQTKDKTYLARPDNIAKFTNGRFNPKGLATFAAPLGDPELPSLGPVPVSDPWPESGQIGCLLTEEDVRPEWLKAQQDAVIAVLAPQTEFGPLQTSPRVIDFKAACLADVTSQLTTHFTSIQSVHECCNWVENAHLKHVIVAHSPVGPTQSKIARLRTELRKRDINLCVQIKPYDSIAWANATHGFFRFKSVIPDLIDGL